MKITFPLILIMILFRQAVYGDDPALPRPSSQSPIEFFQEEIILSVNNSEATINGIYYFRNNTDKDGEFPVLFPFHVDSLSLFPHSIKPYIIDSNKVTELNFQLIRDANSISIAIPLKSHSTTKWYLDYSQVIKAPKARYIVTSTNAWHKPLKEATYRFVVPADYDGVSTWPSADTSYKDGANTVFLSHRLDFLPQKDMEISWIKK